MRLKSLFVAIMLLLSAASAFAAGPTLSLGNVSGVQGQSVTIPVTLTTNGANIGACEVQLDYDPAVLTPTGATLGPAGTAASKTVNPVQVNSARYVVGVYALNTTSIGDGVVANVTFAISSTATGTPVILNVPSASDPDGNDVSISGTGSTITLPDTTVPTISGFVIPSTSDTRTIAVSTTTSDNVGVTGWLLTESTSTPSLTDTGWAGTAPTSYSFTSDGAKTLYLWVKDAAGNLASRSGLTTVDTAAPAVQTFTVTSPVTTLVVPVTALTATDNIGVTGYLITESATAPSATASGWTTAAPTSFTASGIGVTTLYAWAKDALGHVSTAKTAAVVINLPDTEVPVMTSFNASAVSSTMSAAITSLIATDNKGVTGYLVTESATAPSATDAGWKTSITSYIFTTYGSKTLYAWAKDAAGNVSTSRSVNLNIVDTTAPTVSAFTIPATGTTLAVAVTSFTATDDAAGGVTGYLITESSTKPSASASGWSSTVPASYTVSTGGSKTLYAWAKDAAGNVSAVKSATIVITLPDTELPVVTAFTATADSVTLTATGIAITATDNIGVTGYLVTESSTAPAASATGWSASVPASFTVSGFGTKTLYAWAKDAVGNVSVARTISLTFTDGTAPVVSAFTAAASTTRTVNVSITASDLGGVTGYLITESDVAPLAGATGWNATAPTTFTVSGDGNFTLYAWAKDAAGNVSASKSATVSIDTIAPTVTTFTAPSFVKTLTIPVAFVASDSTGSGVAGYLITESATAPTSGWSTTAPASYTVAAAGSKTLYAWVKDAAGNVSAFSSATVVVDLTAPVLLPSMLENNTYTADAVQNISGNVTDAESGLSALTISLNGGEATPVVPETNGNFTTSVTLVAGANTITIVATDVAGNSTTVARTINLDTTAPVIDKVTPTEGAITNVTFVTVTGEVTEGTVKVSLNGAAANAASMNGNVFTLSVGPLLAGLNTIQVDATDLAGNTASSVKRSVLYVDKAPTLSITDPSKDIVTRFADYQVQGLAKFDNSAYSNVEFSVKLAVDGVTVNPALALDADGIFKQTISFADEKAYAVTATVTDATGNTTSMTRNIRYQKYTIQDVLKALRITIGADTKTDADSVLDLAPYVGSKPAPDGSIDISDVIVLLNYAVGNYK
ncbi:hypothetical protein LPW11_02290 [Geomonas sp. RF6]|uniref:cohesin domain-containing protein n=1 Tax=Geomonas sp. RF6 TaxID=2897342 RepID=UPI001E637D79|nr:cohesin domain-containing protein [Geomonas sp. RF6]UFS71027.1 hypothetical protein LPW11_02290 [Geomonas sp. RF6]